MARPLKTENEDTKGTIFKCAIELFMRFGYEGASIRDITKKCGIRESSFYYHFKSKEDLLDSIYNAMDTFLENSKPSLLQLESMLTSLSPIQFFEMFFSAYSDSHDELSNKIALFIMKEDFRNERAKEYVLEKNCRDMAKFITNILEKYKALGKINISCDCDFIAHELNYYYLGMLIEWTHVKYEEEEDGYLRKRLKQHVANTLRPHIK